MQDRCRKYSLTAEHLEQLTKNSDWVPPSSHEAVMEMMRNKVMDPAHHPRDKGQGGSSIQPSTYEEPESPPVTKKTRSMCRTIPSMNLL